MLSGVLLTLLRLKKEKFDVSFFNPLFHIHLLAPSILLFFPRYNSFWIELGSLSL